MKTFQRTMFILLRITVMCTSCLSQHRFSCCSIFFSVRRFSIRRKKKSAKIKCLLFRPKPQKFHIAEITGYTVYISRDYVVFTYRSLRLWWHLQSILEVMLVYKVCQVPVYHLLTKSKQQVNIRIQVMNIHI